MLRIVHTSKSPFEIFLLVAVLLSGLAGLFFPSTTNAIGKLLPLWGQYVWYTGLLGSGVICTVGVVTSYLWSLFVERGGLMMLGTLCLMYTAAVIILVGPIAAFAGVITLGLGVACFVRSYQITRDIKRLLDEGSS